MTATALVAAKPEGYLRGVLLVAGGGFMWSLGGLLFRMIEDAQIWQIVAWRTFFMFVTMGCYLTIRYRGRVVGMFTGMGLGGLAAAISIATANICYMFSLSQTWVANTNLILGASPILAALIAFVLLKERVRRATIIAMVLVGAGIATMVGGGLGTGRVMGDLMAVAAVTAFAMFAVCIRAGQSTDMLPSVVLGTFFSSVTGTCLALGGGVGLAVTGHDLMVFVLMGTMQMTLGMIFFIAGSRNVPAAELAMLSLTEVIFGPIWVAVLIHEIPDVETFIGGVLVLSGIVFNAATGIRRRYPLPQV
jgi:drug/metabolite transporter (DMT)-like permease